MPCPICTVNNGIARFFDDDDAPAKPPNEDWARWTPSREAEERAAIGRVLQDPSQNLNPGNFGTTHFPHAERLAAESEPIYCDRCGSTEVPYVVFMTDVNANTCAVCLQRFCTRCSCNPDCAIKTRNDTYVFQVPHCAICCTSERWSGVGPRLDATPNSLSAFVGGRLFDQPATDADRERWSKPPAREPPGTLHRDWARPRRGRAA